MINDSRNLEDNKILEADICVVGGGAAGISIAREYIGTKYNVVVLESGGLEFDSKIQSLYSGKNIGLPSFDVDVNRLRYFGGTTNHWAGHSRPLDPIDFEEKQWMPNSGWPLTGKDLESYYRRSQDVLELGKFHYENLPALTEASGRKLLGFDDTRLKSVVYGQSPPTRFGARYREEIMAADNVSVYLHANVMQLEASETGNQIASIDCQSIEGPNFSVKAKNVILATGGMENARLLLLSNSVHSNGLGNDNDLVGRYFCDHILLRPGVTISYSRPDVDLKLYNEIHRFDGGQRFAVVAAAEQLLRTEQLNNFRVHIKDVGPRYDPPVGDVFTSTDAAVRNNNPTTEAQASTNMSMVMEPSPNRNSRITLSAHERDFLNQPKLEVNWQIKNRDLKNANRAMELLALEFGRMGIGRGFSQLFLDSLNWPDHLEAGKHHCGTTRMASEPTRGVVDQNCKVFGISNLYVAGSSVFPNIGYANPTITIVALALRLSDHLKAKLR